MDVIMKTMTIAALCAVLTAGAFACDRSPSVERGIRYPRVKIERKVEIRPCVERGNRYPRVRVERRGFFARLFAARR